ncbi:hypothetical protein BDR06DRAFT_843353, partial [Suillus hirtellus]
ILKDAMLFFLHSTSNLVTVIPAMDLINEKLTTYFLNASFLPSIRVAVGLTKKTLNCYYQLTDISEVYHIAMVLHPCHKLTYFRCAKWEDAWIETA